MDTVRVFVKWLEPDRPQRTLVRAGAHPCDRQEWAVRGCGNETGDEEWHGCNLCDQHRWDPVSEFLNHVVLVVDM